MDVKSLPQQIIVFFLVISSVFNFILALREPVQTNNGLIAGTVFQYKNKCVQAYLGIPYAEPPVGNLRFQKPVAKNNWSGTLQAKEFPSACLQHKDPRFPWEDVLPNQSEDCLYLNVWVPPDTSKDSKKAVMVWIYCGGFQTGSNRIPMYYGQVLATEGDVIFVAMNYRLSILGFLSTGTKEVPGNMGLYDILEAIKWVKCNIGAFGGDSDNVTIFGQSSGAIAGGLLCVSPLAEGLFKRAILQSGSPAYALNDNTKANVQLAQKVAKAVGCVSDVNGTVINWTDVVKCLRKKSARTLVELAKKFAGQIGFSPITGDEFMPTDPRMKLITGVFNKVAVMIGHTQDEGSHFLTRIDPETFGALGEKNPHVNKTFGENFMRKVFKDFLLNELIVKYYLGGLKENDYDAVREQIYNSLGDFIIACPDSYFAESYAKMGNDVYAYYFNHIPSVTPWAPWMGSVHFDEVAFVFGRPQDCKSNYTPAERCLSRRLVRIWTNFAKTGVPCENWQTYSRINPYFKIFNISNRTNNLETHKKNCEFFRPIIGFL